MEEINELDKVKPEKVTLMIHGKEREIKYTFSTWAKLEKEYNGFKNIDKLQKKMEDEPLTVIPHLIYLGLLDKSPFIDEFGKEIQITEENVLDDYTLSDLSKITDVFSKALFGSLPEDDEKKVEMEA